MRVEVRKAGNITAGGCGVSEVLAGLLDGECGIECVMELATPWTQAGWVTVAGTFGAPKPKNLRAFALVFSWVLRSFAFLRFSRHPFPA